MFQQKCAHTKNCRVLHWCSLFRNGVRFDISHVNMHIFIYSTYLPMLNVSYFTISMAFVRNVTGQPPWSKAMRLGSHGDQHREGDVAFHNC